MWTVLYLVVRGSLTPLAVLVALMVGGSAQLYYLVVYLQLALLTPWLFRMLDRPATRMALYAVTPATLCIRYAISVAGASLPIQAFCGSWLIFYLLGLDLHDRIAPWLRSGGVDARRALLALVACLVLQELEGFSWFLAGSYDLATTQLKATSLLSSMCACSLIAFAAEPVRHRLAGFGLLVRLGDLSFGIYLCHTAVLAVFRRLFGLAGLSGFPPALILWLAVLAASAAFVALCRRLLPKRVLFAIGFA